MQFNTKLNVGETIWVINNNIITETAITRIHVTQSVSNNPLIEYVTDEKCGDNYLCVIEEGENISWWRTRDAILSHVMTTINERAKTKTAKSTAQTLSDEFDEYFKEPTCDDECPCGCQSRPRLPEEDEMGELYAKPSPNPKSFEEVFEEIFPSQARQEAKKAVKTVIGKTKTELDDLYEQVFGKDKKP